MVNRWVVKYDVPSINPFVQDDFPPETTELQPAYNRGPGYRVQKLSCKCEFGHASTFTPFQNATYPAMFCAAGLGAG